MIKVISVDNKSIDFTEDEIKLSALLKTMCLGENFEKSDEVQLPKVTFDNLFYIKRLSKVIINKNITEKVVDKSDCFEDLNNTLNDYLKITTEFTIENLFTLLDCVNFLENIIIVKIIKKKIDTILKYSTVDDIIKIFKLDNFDGEEMEQMDILKKLVC
tara:strand:- start:21 stop:497 length:477 start_codon:yes stop_codon:yes gene_type:complete